MLIFSACDNKTLDPEGNYPHKNVRRQFLWQKQCYKATPINLNFSADKSLQ